MYSTVGYLKEKCNILYCRTSSCLYDTLKLFYCSFKLTTFYLQRKIVQGRKAQNFASKYLFKNSAWNRKGTVQGGWWNSSFFTNRTHQGHWPVTIRFKYFRFVLLQGVKKMWKIDFNILNLKYALIKIVRIPFNFYDIVPLKAIVNIKNWVLAPRSWLTPRVFHIPRWDILPGVQYYINRDFIFKNW